MMGPLPGTTPFLACEAAIVALRKTSEHRKRGHLTDGGTVVGNAWATVLGAQH